MAATASSTQSIDIVRTFNDEVFNGRNYDRLSDIQSEQYVQHGPMHGMEFEGIAESLETMKLFHGAFSDLKAVEEFTFSDGDLVCTRYTWSGTHDGDLMGIPATGIEVELEGTVINRVEDGEIVETWTTGDFLGLFQQLGVVPSIDTLAS